MKLNKKKITPEQIKEFYNIKRNYDNDINPPCKNNKCEDCLINIEYNRGEKKRIFDEFSCSWNDWERIDEMLKKEFPEEIFIYNIEKDIT
jgi:hypothetical protein